MAFNTFIGLAIMTFNKSQYNIISKLSVRFSLKKKQQQKNKNKQTNKKRSSKIFPQETMAACENRFAPELNEKEVIELLENAIPGNIKKPPAKCGMKIFKGKNLKTTLTN